MVFTAKKPDDSLGKFAVELKLTKLSTIVISMARAKKN